MDGGMLMTDSIIFLGTGGDAIVVGKQIRASGGVVLQLEGNQFFLDPGPGSLIRARQADVNIRDTIAVLASTPSINFSNDLNVIVDTLTVSGLDVMGVVVAAKSVIEGDDNEVPVLSKKSSSWVERVISLEPGRKISINNINILPTRTSFPESHSIGFIFETQKYRIGYTSETEYSEDVADQYKNCDILILTCKNPKGLRERGCMNCDDAASFLRRARPSRAIITGFGIKLIQSNPIQEARELQRDTKVEVLAASDGLVINPASFAARMKQIHLDEFSSRR
ncbi:hypothetical protein JW826_02350 [Candidatus Woesearchaeota archaeon]|nr:hypothetical protein [Candidatus Woesearchaeota archaeon]